MITSLLIANRGEIACRIIRTCRRLGIRAVAVYSDADARARHVELADEAIRIGPPPASESYLVVDAIVAAARRAAVDAIHPGYGFLAENGDFARACAAAGILFIGPTPAAIAALGDKRAARELAARAGVPTIPGYDGADQSDGALRRAAGRIGWPLIVKAAWGGGGKGMRVVQRLADLDAALAAARHEARQAFGSDELVLERALPAPRHIEFQIFGDQHGNLIHLGERECSIQRRHQKVIEEAPAPELTQALRAAIGAAAVAVGRAAGYTNAGTVEFLLDRERRFYFLEINTRLQVEHPITECTTGLDLVEWQIRVAEGQALPLRQEDVQTAGHGVEARLYAEDPANGFLPATGEILFWREPAGEGVRVDSGIRSGDQVSIYYDPLLAKIVAYGPDRAVAIRRLVRALETTALLGIRTNLSFLRAVLDHPAFQAGAVSTAYLAEHFAGWAEPADATPLALIAATLVQWVQHPQLESNRGYWRNNRDQPQLYRFVAPPRAEPVEVRLTPARQAATFQIALSLEPDVTVAAELNALEPARMPVAAAHPARPSQPERGTGGEGRPVAHELTLTVEGHRQRVTFVCAEDAWWVQTRRGIVRLRSVPLLPEPAPPADAGGSLRAPMPGTVLAVLVDMGQRVSKGDPLLKLEAMKMEHTIRTAADGVVEAIYFAPGATVEADALLVKIREND